MSSSGAMNPSYYHHHTSFSTINNWTSIDWKQFPGIPFAFSFETHFARDYHRKWLYDNWHVAIYISIFYVILLLIGKRWMERRVNGLNLRALMSVWSMSLALFSLFGTIRCLPEFISVIYSHGLYSSYCISSYYDDVRLTFWYWIFVWSKVVELGDTAFIILRKQKLISLHWIHHVLTLWYAFYVIGDAPGTARWMVNMNFLIHTMMYFYYGCKAARINISRTIAMVITLAQIVQMIFGLYINFNAYMFKSSGIRCDLSLSSAASGLFIYSLFFVLFINFFVKAYLSRFISKMKLLLSFKKWNDFPRAAAKDAIKVD